MVGGVEDRARVAGRAGQRDAEDHVADVADQGEGQHPLDLGLRDRAQDADDHRDQRGPQEERGQVAVAEEQRLRADDRVHADLGQQAGEHRRHRGRRGRVGVRQPGRHREHGGLDREHRQQQQLQHQRDVGRQVTQPHRQLGEVHRAGGGVDRGDGDQEQRRGQQADQDVGAARPDPRARAAEGEQHVRGEQQHLEADEEVEQVAGEERVGDAGGQHQERRVEDRDRGLAPPFRLRAHPWRTAAPTA